jgi:hypothetical protein
MNGSLRQVFDMDFFLCRTIPGQPSGASEDEVSNACESSEDGRLPALRCGGWCVAGMGVN